MHVFVFDTETTGLVANHTIKIGKQPHIIEFYGCLVNLETGEISNEIDLLIKPPSPLLDTPAFGDKKTTTQITGITNEMLASAPTFNEIAGELFAAIETAPLIASHNLSYDMEMLDLEAERLGIKIKWPRGFCTVEQTVHFKGHRLKMGDLYEHLFNERFTDAHRAKADTRALVRCIVELHKREVV
jgi:DNA polymerase III epsilon subunit-like protein